MKRREFITLIGGAATAWPVAARGQQGERMRRIGVLMTLAADDLESQQRLTAFAQTLQELGWTDGRNIRIEYRYGAGDHARIRQHAAELAALAPDVIMTTGSVGLAPLLQATRTVPIVFTIVPDPVGAGFVDSLARPGGNATGFTQLEYGLSGKWLELLREIAPGVTRVGVLRESDVTAAVAQFAVLQSLAPSLRVELVPLNVRDAGDIERSIAAFVRSANDGLIVTSSPLPAFHRKLIVALAARHGSLPSILHATWPPTAGRYPMGRISSNSTGAQPATSIASSRARSRPTCRCRRLPNSSWRSTSRPPKRSASKYRRCCSREPTR